MSDDERGPRGGGYRLEIAKTSQAKCKGPKPCNGNKIEKGSLRFGTMVMIQDRNNFAWRHWGCVTPKILENLKKKHDVASDIDGFEEISEEFQSKVEKAYEDGHVADEDIPDTARKPEGEKKEKKKATKKRARREDGEDEEAPTKPASKRKTKARYLLSLTPISIHFSYQVAKPDEAEKPKKGRKKANVEEDLDEEEMSQNKRSVLRKKTVVSKASKKSKVIEDDSGEDFGDELDKVGDDEDEGSSQTEIKPTKRAKSASKTSKSAPKTSRKPSSKASKATSSRAKKTSKPTDDDDD